MHKPSLPIVVAGAGVVGVCCAWELLRRGHSVCLLDPEPPASGCSAGNAGVFAAESIAPLASPGMLARLPSMLVRRQAPLRIDPGHLPSLIPWLLRYLWAARPAQIARSTQALADLLGEAVTAWRQLLDAAELTTELQNDGWLLAYSGERAFAADDAERKLQSAHGIRWELLDQQQRQQYAPALSQAITHLVRYPDSAWSLDPQALVRNLARRFQAEGGRIIQASLSDIEQRGTEALRLRTSQDEISAEQLILCLGADSAAWVEYLDRISIPLQPERGYHLQFDQPCAGLTLPVMFTAHKIVATPMRAGLRLAGTAEFARPERGPDYSRAEAFRRSLTPLIDGLPQTPATSWMGRRPTLPDSLPIISRARSSNRIYFNFGHQHLGLTLAAVSALRLADLLAAGPDSANRFEDFTVERFARY